MSDKPKPHGRYDTEYLSEAVQVNETLTRLLPNILDKMGRPPQPVVMLFQQAGFELARQRAALAQMQLIREQYKHVRKTQ